MQRDAETRVRDMNNRNRQVAQNNEVPLPQGGWSSNPGMYRPRSRRSSQGTQQTGQGQQRRREAPGPPPQSPPPPPPPQEETPPVPGPEPAAPEAPPKKDGTIIGDIMNALSLDEDYLLIIGLMLILINQRADTTLILALAYLLI